jgi:hypothetical protein
VALILLMLLITGVTVCQVRPYPVTPPHRHVCRRYRTRNDDDEDYEGFAGGSQMIQDTIQRIRQSKAVASGAAGVRGASVKYI